MDKKILTKAEIVKIISTPFRYTTDAEKESITNTILYGTDKDVSWWAFHWFLAMKIVDWNRGLIAADGVTKKELKVMMKEANLVPYREETYKKVGHREADRMLRSVGVTAGNQRMLFHACRNDSDLGRFVLADLLAYFDRWNEG